MEKYIERLTQGQFEYERGNLEFSEQRIELRLAPGREAEGSFRIFGPEDRPVEGHVSSDEIRMKVLTPAFSGAGDTIGYRFDAAYLVSGDVLQGNFRIVSNRGEYLLPFVVTIEIGHVESTLGEIRNLFHFTNLAKTDWKEAVRLFSSDAFSSILSGHDAAYLSLYRGLMPSADPEQSLEEFLLSTRKKQPLVYLPEHSEIRMENPQQVTEESLTITRNGWGLTGLSVETDAAFLSCEKTALEESDFTGNSCRLRYRILPEHLHAGVNLGALVFRSHYDSFTVRFRIHLTEGADARRLAHRKKQLTLSLIKLYEAFRMHRVASGRFLQEAGDLTAQMRQTDETDAAFVLYRAHFLITARKEEEGAALLAEWRPLFMNTDTEDVLRCYYLYLTTLVPGQEAETEAIARQIRSALFGNPADWRIAWLLQFVSPEYRHHASKKWELFREQYERGCRSPIIYIEALQVAAAYPATLMRPDAFEKAILRRAVRGRQLPEKLMDRVVYLAKQTKQYEATLFEALALCYEMRPQEETLTELCAMLIKGARTDAEAFSWYGRGIQGALRLTRLYEYYMMSAGTDAQGAPEADIPRSVLMYFSHGSDLDRRANAVLYRYVSDHKDIYPDLYAMYEPRILAFVRKQLDDGIIDETMAQLYKKYLRPDMVNRDNARTVLRMLHTCRIRIGRADMTEVIVVYDRLRSERRYPVSEGEALVPLYGGDYSILLADKGGMRYAAGVPFETFKFLIPGRMIQATEPYMGEGEGYIDFFLCEQGSGVYGITMENAKGFRALKDSELIDEDCRREIRLQLIQFYRENDFTRQLTESLDEIDPGALQGKRRGQMLEMMVLYGSAERVLAWLKRCGTYGTDTKLIMRMCARLTDIQRFTEDRDVVEIVHYAFRKGRYDNNVLEFLKESFRGTLREMRDIWKACTAFGVDTRALSEKMVLQMLYSGAYVGERPEIFRDYVQQGARTEVEIAFLAQSAYDHFVRESVTGEFIYRRIGRLMAAGTSLPDVCGMDYLKFFAGHRTGEFDQALAEQILSLLLEKDIYFPFFSDYADVLPQARRFADLVMLQYRTAPGKRCVVHYSRGDVDRDGEAVFSGKRMREMYDSIYVFSFVLFFGEELQYYITEGAQTEEEGAELLTESGALSRGDIRQADREGDRYALINDLCVAEALKDYETFDRLLQEYFHTGFLTEQLFRLKDANDAAKG